MDNWARTLGAIGIAVSLLSTSGIAAASEFQKFARRDQVAASNLIAVGRVASVTSAWSADHSKIETRSDVAVEETWKGAAPARRVTVVTPGGTVDNVAAKIDGAAEFSVGEHVLVFLRKSGSEFEPAGMRFGKYEIVGAGSEAVVVGNLPTDVEEAQRYEQVSLPLDDVRAEVAAIVGGPRR